MNLERKDIGSAQDKSLSLIEDRVSVFDLAGEVSVIRALDRQIRVDVVNGVRPHVACQNLESVRKAMAEIYCQRVVVGIAIVHVTQDLRVGWLRIAGRVWIAGGPELRIEVDPVRTRAVGLLRCA